MINLTLNKKVIIFGFIFTFFSSFGQSFFLGLFNAPIRNELGISHGQFGSIFAIATISSSLVLIWVGKKIDDYNLINYSIFVIILLSFSSFFFSNINNIFLLFVGIFLMRLSGQGLMGHTASTAVSRFFNKNRGKALGITWLGLSSSEFILPICITLLLSILSWDKVWIIISVFIIILLPIISLKTIKTINLDSRESNKSNSIDEKIKHWKRVEVIKDYKFYIIAANLLAMPWIATGIFVYQSFITESKLWSDFAIPKAFMAYSIMSILTIFLAGSMIDRFTSRKIIPFMNIPLLLAMFVLYFGNSEIYSFILFGLLGISNGLSNLLGSSTWAEIYGVKYIGGIKALTTSFMVFSTAFGTAIFGLLIDKQLSIETIAIVCSTYIITMFIILIVFRKQIEPIKLVN